MSGFSSKSMLLERLVLLWHFSSELKVCSDHSLPFLSNTPVIAPETMLRPLIFDIAAMRATFNHIMQLLTSCICCIDVFLAAVMLKISTSISFIRNGDF
jgi:hypothetical protein